MPTCKANVLRESTPQLLPNMLQRALYIQTTSATELCPRLDSLNILIEHFQNVVGLFARLFNLVPKLPLPVEGAATLDKVFFG
jgi:hypothetical protein